MEIEGVPEQSRLGPGPGETDDEQAAFGGVVEAAEVWLLQAEAAELAGCSVSAIRKWRREGSVSSRRTATPGGMERVEVRLTDVMTRAGKRTVAASPPSLAGPVAAPPVAGTVLVSLADLQAMFERSAAPDRRSDDLQAHYRSLESEVSFMRGQLARLTARAEERPRAHPQVEELERRVARMEAETERLRRQLEALTKELEKLVVARQADRQASQSTSETAIEQSPPVRPATEDTGPRPEAPTFEGWLEGRPPPPDKPPAPTGPPIERLADELGRLYQILSTRPRTPLGPEERARWAAELRRYDTVLVRACSRLGVATDHRPGDRLTAPDRVGLTKALADAGLDVRRSPASVDG